MTSRPSPVESQPAGLGSHPAHLTASPSLAEHAPGIVRPELRRDCPLVWRGIDRIQFGADDDAPILDRMTPALARWLIRLDGLRTWDEIDAGFAQAPSSARQGWAEPVSYEDARRALRAATRAGALADAAAIPHHWRWLGLDEREQARADLAAAALTLRDSLQANELIERRNALLVSVTGTGFLARELASALALGGVSLVSDDAPSIDIRVLADSAHPRVVEEFDTPAHEGPHLAAGLFGSTGIVGPLVVPGVTGCLRCSHLHAADADPHWPAVSLQIASAVRQLPVQPRDRLLTRLVAAQAALLIRQWADDPTDLDRWADLAIEIRLPAGELRRVPRPPHPLCGCRWPDAGRAAS